MAELPDINLMSTFQTYAIGEILKEGPAKIQSFYEKTGINERGVSRILNEMQQWGLVKSELKRTEKSPRERYYSFTERGERAFDLVKSIKK